MSSQEAIPLIISPFSTTKTLVVSYYTVINPVSGVSIEPKLEACFIPIGYNKWNMDRASIHMHPSLATPSTEEEKKFKIHHRFYFVKPNGEKQQFHEQKMYMYKTHVYEEILVTIDGEFFKANPHLVSENDTLKIVIEPEIVNE